MRESSNITPAQAIANVSARLEELKAQHQAATVKLQSLRSEHHQRPEMFHDKEIAAWLAGEQRQNTEDRARLAAEQDTLQQEMTHLEKEIIPRLQQAQAAAECDLLLTKVQSAAEDCTHALQDWEAEASKLLPVTEHVGFALGFFRALERRYSRLCQQTRQAPEVLPNFEPDEQRVRALVRNQIFELWAKGADAGQAKGDNEQ